MRCNQPAPFSDKAVVQKLMDHSGSLAGRIATLLTQAAELVIRQKSQFIRLDLVVDAAAAGVFKIPAEQGIDDALA